MSIFKVFILVNTMKISFNINRPLSGNETKKVREIRGSHSTKVGAIVETLLQLQETHPGEKCIIFSTVSYNLK